jgi:hypothetical protein
MKSYHLTPERALAELKSLKEQIEFSKELGAEYLIPYILKEAEPLIKYYQMMQKKK